MRFPAFVIVLVCVVLRLLESKRSPEDLKNWPNTGPFVVTVEYNAIDSVREKFEKLYQQSAKTLRGVEEEFKWKHKYVKKDKHNTISIKGVSIEDLIQIPGVVSVDPNPKVHKKTATFEDSINWGRQRVSQPDKITASWADDLYDIPYPFDYIPGYTGKGVDVYILDTGIDFSEPTFSDSNGVLNDDYQRTVEVSTTLVHLSIKFH